MRSDQKDTEKYFFTRNIVRVIGLRFAYIRSRIKLYFLIDNDLRAFFGKLVNPVVFLAWFSLFFTYKLKIFII